MKITINICLIIALLALPVSCNWTVHAIGCWQKLSDSGKDYRYKMLKGCQYQTSQGWLNYDRLRDLGN